MGVHGLWDLLAPVGRRVSVETLAGKKLAIDASIWMVQFIKAMRDEKGEMVRNAHILGFFRRICKLLFLRTKPVFVFDGGTPALKRRTVAARRRNRENATAKIRKTAEKLLLNHLKRKKLEELALELRNGKGKQVVVDGDAKEKQGVDAASQEKLDELLAASLAAEEEGKFVDAQPSSTAEVVEENNDDEEEEEMMFPIMNDNIDPAVLASLPPSMQLDLLVQMRERLMAENRQKYQKIKNMPAKFSELQIQSYLKTVAFRREINEVQKIASGDGLGGVQTSRIASESSREFIFSSSFTGDKQTLTPAGFRNDEKITPHTSEGRLKLDKGRTNLSTNKIKFVSQACVDEQFKNFGDDVETFRDDRGRVRVSRVRGLGLHMTRDLQRNLALMNENVNDNDNEDILNDVAHINKDKDILSVSEGEHEASNADKGIIEISFSKEASMNNDIVDDLFSSLVSGNSVSTLSLGVTPSENLSDSDGSGSNIIWEEGKAGNELNDNHIERDLPREVKVTSEKEEEKEIDWEEGVCESPVINFSCEMTNSISRGNVEEESDLQEAIRRSLQDLQHEKPGVLNMQTSKEEYNPSTIPHATLQHGCSPNSMVNEFDQTADSVRQESSVVNGSDQIVYSSRQDSLMVNGFHQIVDSAREDSIISSMKNFSSSTIPEATSCANLSVINPERPMVLVSHDICVERDLGKPCVANTLSNELKARDSNLHETHDKQNSKEENFIRHVGRNETQENVNEVISKHDSDIHGYQDVAAEVFKTNIGIKNNLANFEEAFQPPENKTYLVEGQIQMQQDIMNDVKHMEAEEVPAVSLDEEILHLRHEQEQIGDMQKKLERNAETVSSEMFVECQELLQMFGLPYIIAPMEAEAQCAHMELINLVDGVVTDDSDVFLFGARSIYKNIFDDRKYVETYFMKDIETELGLTREKLIRMALLLGSDYTEGISGVGIVNAIEIINAFPEDDGFHKFKEWVESPDPSLLRKLDPHTSNSKRSSKTSGTNDEKQGNDIEVSLSDEINSCRTSKNGDNISEAKEIFICKHRNISKNWHIPSSFPSESVVSAYTAPQVDDSTESFSWGKPDLSLLRKLCWDRFGWSNQKADELLLPVLNEYNKHETQLRLEAFYTFNERFAKIRSKRIKKAVKGITGNLSVNISDDPVQASSRKRKISHSSKINSEGKIPSCGPAQTSASSQKARVSRSKKNQTEENIHHYGSMSETPGEEQMKFRNENQNQKRKRLSKGNPRITGQNKEKEVAPRRSARKQIRQNYKEEFSEGDGPSSPLNVEDREDPSDIELEKGSVIGHEQGQNVEHDISMPLGQSMPMKPCAFKKDTVVVNEEPMVNDGGATEDYLLNGGGFCIQDGEPDKKTSSTRKASFAPGISHHSDDRLGPCSEKAAQSNTAATDGNNSAETEATTVTPQEEFEPAVLSAMPYLRRKKKIF